MGGGSEHKLPDVWNKEMDFFICDCDARDVDPKVMMKTLKRLFPELRRHAGDITLLKIANRVRILDQIPEIKYFKPGAVARYRQAVEEGRLEDDYPEDVNYLNSAEMLKDSELSKFDGSEGGELSGYTSNGKGEHVRTLSGGFLDASPTRNEIRADYLTRPHGSDDTSKTQATSLLDRLRDRSDPKPPKPPKTPPIKLTPVKEAARARAANLKERMQAKHSHGSSSASEGHGLRLRAGNVDMEPGEPSSFRPVGVEDVFGGMALGTKSSSARSRC